MTTFVCKMVNLAIVEDNRALRNHLIEGLRQYDFINVCLVCTNGAEFLESLSELGKTRLPEIVLMDIDMPEMNGINAVKNAKVIYPGIEFLMLTVFDEDEKIFDAIRAGASGYLLKDESIKDIANFVYQVKEFRAVPMSPSVARKTLKMFTEDFSTDNSKLGQLVKLGERETEVLRLMVEGLDYKKIAERLGISHYTVRNQITSIYQKLHVNCKVDAVKLAIKNKLID